MKPFKGGVSAQQEGNLGSPKKIEIYLKIIQHIIITNKQTNSSKW